MNKPLKAVLVLVMAAAVLVMGVCAVHYMTLRRQLSEDENTLAESRATWERIAAEKEELQDQLKKLKDELKEAELSLSEATDRAEELRADIAALQQEISLMKTPSD